MDGQRQTAQLEGSFSILYTGTNAGYRVWGRGRIAADGSVSGIARDSNKLTLPFTMPAGPGVPGA